MAGLSNIRGTWVQTERAAHEAWAALIGRQPRAAALLHLMVANMDRSGALVASQGTLGKLMGVSVATIKRALIVLTDECWIDVVRVGSERGGVNAYVVNRRVAWADKRENQRYAAFDARILLAKRSRKLRSLITDHLCANCQLCHQVTCNCHTVKVCHHLLSQPWLNQICLLYHANIASKVAHHIKEM